MKKSNNKTADISIPRLAVITGKIDIADWKVNQHFKDIDPTNSNYINQIYHKVIRTGRFAFDLKRFFLQPNLKLFNEYLKANHGEYTYEYNDDNSTNPQIPSIQFTLVPLSETNQ